MAWELQVLELVGLQLLQALLVLLSADEDLLQLE
jgi:hypothetical protein